MIQQELDEFEKMVLTDLFGGYTSNYMRVMGFDITNYVRKGITIFEARAKQYMDLDGNLDIPSLKIKAKPTEIYRTLKGKNNDERRSENNASALPTWFNDTVG